MPAFPEWTTSSVIALAALIVASFSLFVSWLNYHRLSLSDRVTAWIDLKRHGTSEYYLATLSMKNPSNIAIKLTKLAIDIPDFRVANIDATSIQDEYGNIVLPSKITLESPVTGLFLPEPIVISTGETKTFKFLIFQPAHNRQRSTGIRVMYWTMEPKQKWRILPLRVTTRPNY